MGERLGKQVIVDNRTGAGGVIGTELAAHAPPDGYTILVISIAHAVNPWLYKLPYDPIKAFAPIGIMGTGTNVLTVHPSLPVNSLKEFLAMAKEKPGELSYASAGIGTFQHLGAELFKLDGQGQPAARAVPGRRAGPDRRARRPQQGHVLLARPGRAAHQVRPAAGARHRRQGARPGAGRRSDDLGGRRSRLRGAQLVGPAGAGRHAAAVIERLHKALEEAQDAPEIQEQFAKEGAATRKMSSAEFGKFIESEMNKWERVVKEGGIKAE